MYLEKSGNFFKPNQKIQECSGGFRVPLRGRGAPKIFQTDGFNFANTLIIFEQFSKGRRLLRFFKLITFFCSQTKNDIFSLFVIGGVDYPLTPIHHLKNVFVALPTAHRMHWAKVKAFQLTWMTCFKIVWSHWYQNKSTKLTMLTNFIKKFCIIRKTVHTPYDLNSKIFWWSLFCILQKK